MMTEKFVEAVAGLAVGKQQPLHFHPPEEPCNVYYLRDTYGNYKRQVAELGPRSAQATNLETLAALARDGGSELWVDDNNSRVVLLPGGKADRERVVLYFRQSSPLALLRVWDDEGARLEQRELYRLLRTTLATCVVAPIDLAKLIGRVDVTKSDRADSQVAKGRVSVDRSMMAAAAGVDQLPDEVRFSVPLFAWPVLPDTAELTVAFELDPATTPPRFQLDVYPGEIEAADQKVLDVLAGRLAKLCEGKEVAIYFGSPDAA